MERVQYNVPEFIRTSYHEITNSPKEITQSVWRLAGISTHEFEELELDVGITNAVNAAIFQKAQCYDEELQHYISALYGEDSKPYRYMCRAEKPWRKLVASAENFKQMKEDNVCRFYCTNFKQEFVNTFSQRYYACCNLVDELQADANNETKQINKAIAKLSKHGKILGEDYSFQNAIAIANRTP